MTQTVQAEMQASDNIGANLIINGDMRIDQRGGAVSPGNGTYTLDRWQHIKTDAGNVTVSQDTDVPSGSVFSNSLKVDVTTADASVAAGDLREIRQQLEGFNTAQLLLGTANAKQFTVSFWVKSDTKTGTMCVSLANNASDRNYLHEITIADNNWNQYSFTVTGDTTGTWIGATNGVGLRIEFCLVSGTTYQGAADTWQAGPLRATSNQTNFMDSATNNVWITGVKLEVGNVATTFVPDDYGTALAKCQRYYEKSYNAGVNPGSGSFASFFAGQIENTSTNGDKLPGPSYKVSKRTSATVTTYGISGTAGTFSNGGGTDLAASSCTVNIPGTEGFVPYQNSGGNVTTTNRACWYHWVADAEL